MPQAHVVEKVNVDARLVRVDLTDEEVAAADAVVLLADHDAFDLDAVARRAAYVLDMIAHNNDHARDIFQIAPGEGRGAARLAWHAHLANERWNRAVPQWNRDAERKGKGRGKRVEMVHHREMAPISA